MSQIFELKNEFLSLGVSTLGAELTHVHSASGRQLLWEGDENSWKNRAPVLFPICSGLKDDTYTYNGKIYNLTKHGFAKFKEFSGEKISPTKLGFTLRSDEHTLACYPFEFELNIYYELLENTLKVTYVVKNHSDEKMYFSIGAHEGYYCPEGIEQYCLEFENERDLERVIIENGITTYRTETLVTASKILPIRNDYFTGARSVAVRNTDLNKVSLVKKNSSGRITVEFSGFSYFLIWTVPDGKYICLEPWHGICDYEGSDYDITHKEAIIPLETGKEFETNHTITFEE